MIPILSSAQARAFDRFVSEECNIPSLLLMENAGRAAALLVHERIPRESRVLCLCGTGNNGGDGLVVARQLSRLGHRPRVLSFGPRAAYVADAGVNLTGWLGLGGEVTWLTEEAGAAASIGALLDSSDGVVDALFGTGLSRELQGRQLAAVKAVNDRRLPVFALDLPSGLNADTGAVLGAAVRARATITFGHPKPGLLTSRASDYVGELLLADLGVPRDLGPALAPRAHWLEAGDVASWLTPRSRSAHKGRAGRVVIIAGSAGKTGAALLSASAALRAGAGLVTIATWGDAARSLDQRVVEVMTAVIDPGRIGPSLERLLENADAVVVGPGLGTGEDARALVDHVVQGFHGPKVIDADAITLFAARPADLARAPGACLLTPHPGELARLLESSAQAVEADRFQALANAIERTGQTILLKGPHTLIGGPTEAPFVSSAGHPVLASGGSGDVLSGICGALAVELPLLRAGAAAAFLHGRAAQLWSKAHAGADRGLWARELLDYLPAARAELDAGTPFVSGSRGPGAP